MKVSRPYEVRVLISPDKDPEVVDMTIEMMDVLPVASALVASARIFLVTMQSEMQKARQAEDMQDEVVDV